jgi:hypothetical protein
MKSLSSFVLEAFRPATLPDNLSTEQKELKIGNYFFSSRRINYRIHGKKESKSYVGQIEGEVIGFDDKRVELYHHEGYNFSISIDTYNKFNTTPVKIPAWAKTRNYKLSHDGSVNNKKYNS